MNTTFVEPETADNEAECVRLRRDLRMPPKRIAEVLGVKVAFVREALRKYVVSVQERNTDIVEQAFVEQVDLIDKLLELCMVELAHGYSEKSLRSAILLMERQAKLLGIDKEKSHSDNKGSEWLEKASKQELVQYAETLGLRMPDGFVLEGSVV